MLPKYVSFFSLLGVCLLAAVLFWARDKGFDVSDEGYYMYLYTTSKDHLFNISSFHLVQDFLFPFVKTEVIPLRLERLILSILASAGMAFSIYRFLKIKAKNCHCTFLEVFSFTFIGFALSYSLGPQTPAYNFYSIFLWTILLSIILTEGTSQQKWYSQLFFFLVKGSLLALFILIKFPNAFVALIVIAGFLVFQNREEKRNKVWIRMSGQILILLTGYLFFMIFFFFLIRNAIDFHSGFYELILNNYSHHEADSLSNSFFSSLLKIVLSPFKFSYLVTMAAIFILYYTRRKLYLLLITVVLLITGISGGFFQGGNQFLEQQVEIYFLFIITFAGLLKFKSSRESMLAGDKTLSKLYLLLFCIPWIASIGSSNPLTVQLIVYMPFWMVLIFLLVNDDRLENVYAGNVLTIFLILIGVSQTVYAVCLHPYRIHGSLMEQSVRLGKSNVLVDPRFYSSVSYIDSTIEAHGFRQGDLLFVYSEHIGLAYLTGGHIPGKQSFWYDHRVGEVNAKLLGQYFDNEPTCRLYFLLNKSYPLTEDVKSVLRKNGCDFSAAFRLAGTNVLETNGGKDTVQIYVPARP